MATTRQVRSWANRNTNFMTPQIVTIKRIKSLDNVWVELSRGEFLDSPLFGISIIEEKPDLGGDFQTSDKFGQFAQSKHNQIEAEKYFNDVIEMLELIGRATVWK